MTQDVCGICNGNGCPDCNDTGTQIYKEHTLASGFQIIFDVSGNPRKPWGVTCIHSDGKTVQWVMEFVTREEAEKEYTRFD